MNQPHHGHHLNYNHQQPQTASQQQIHISNSHSQNVKIPTASMTSAASVAKHLPQSTQQPQVPVPQLNPPSYYSTFHNNEQQSHHFYYSSNSSQQQQIQPQQQPQQRPINQFKPVQPGKQQTHFYSANAPPTASATASAASTRSSWSETSSQQQQQYQKPSNSPVKFYRQTPSQINYKVASIHHNGTGSSGSSSSSSGIHHQGQQPQIIQQPQQNQSQPLTTSNSTSSSCSYESTGSTGSPGCNNQQLSQNVTMRSRPPTASTRTATASSASAASVASASTVSNRRNAVYVKEVTPEATKSKPPLPSASTCNNMINSGNLEAVTSGQVPKPPPRSRPKSWTSTLFNAMRNNHRSVTFQCVDEEENNLRISTANMVLQGSSEVIVASDPTMPLAAASSADGQKFYSLPRPPNQAKLASGRSRTPSPFRSMIKGLVKGKILLSI